MYGEQAGKNPMDLELNSLLQSVQEAGKAILSLQKTGFDVMEKANNDIVTQADLLANDILKTQLTKAFPDYGWLSEESVDDPERLACHRVWIVDPIDGTKEYAQGRAEYAISVALVEDGIPIIAAVFNPATDELFHAMRGKGAWLGKKKLACNRTVSSEGLLLLASRSEYERGEWDPYQQNHAVKQVGSIAYKLALVAAGEAHATFSLGPKNEWDIAGGTLLVLEAGGVVTDRRKHALMFNRKEVVVDGVVAMANHVSIELYD
ncbi:MAG: 3'(2'),5'-bisphosphate nucleotidase CysQ [Gammaproteobacteria bacterium]|nr:MAG: 3'(2'),5'-bisphosphate nucleotidase CysQ [Gammaproteobacteria bacterium]